MVLVGPDRGSVSRIDRMAGAPALRLPPIARNVEASTKDDMLGS